MNLMMSNSLYFPTGRQWDRTSFGKCCLKQSNLSVWIVGSKDRMDSELGKRQTFSGQEFPLKLLKNWADGGQTVFLST